MVDEINYVAVHDLIFMSGELTSGDILTDIQTSKNLSTADSDFLIL